MGNNYESRTVPSSVSNILARAERRQCLRWQAMNHVVSGLSDNVEFILEESGAFLKGAWGYTTHQEFGGIENDGHNIMALAMLIFNQEYLGSPCIEHFINFYNWSGARKTKPRPPCFQLSRYGVDHKHPILNEDG